MGHIEVAQDWPFYVGEIVTVFPFPQGRSRAVVTSSDTGVVVRVVLESGVRMSCTPDEVEHGFEDPA